MLEPIDEFELPGIANSIEATQGVVLVSTLPSQYSKYSTADLNQALESLPGFMWLTPEKCMGWFPGRARNRLDAKLRRLLFELGSKTSFSEEIDLQQLHNVVTNDFITRSGIAFRLNSYQLAKFIEGALSDEFYVSPEKSGSDIAVGFKNWSKWLPERIRLKRAQSKSCATYWSS